MNNNSNQMTLEQRLVQTLKDESLFKLVGDEDAITELVQRAINEALFQPKRVHDGYVMKEHDSPVVAAAREVANEAIKLVMEEEVKRISESPKIRELLRNAMADAVIGQINYSVEDAINQAAARHAMNNVQLLSDAIRQG